MGKLKTLTFSLPVQLLITHLKKNQVLLIYWVFLFIIITGNFGKILGIPNLFLDPEYLNRVGFWSFFIMGIVIAGFSMAFNITSYILDGHRFSFLGALRRPFTKFCLNNAIIPIAFLIVYTIEIIHFQVQNEYTTTYNLAFKLVGLFAGLAVMTVLLFSYFWATNVDLFKMIANRVEMQLKKVPVTRLNIMQRYRQERQRKIHIESYLEFPFNLKKIEEEEKFYDKYDREAILKVFDQNHLNSVIIELGIFGLILLLGVFKEYPIFQIPAAASTILLLTILVIFTGAISFWFRGWSISVVITLLLVVNFLVKTEWLSAEYQAFGFNYEKPAKTYSLEEINGAATSEIQEQDKKNTLAILENWRKKFPEGKPPRMVFICVSGGGLRAAIWSMRSLQVADKLTGGALMNQTALISGASGGLIGASYFRELKLRRLQGEDIEIYAEEYLNKIANDKLNAIIFTLLVNDLFIRYGKFTYEGFEYTKDRGYAFEQQLNIDTDYMLDKSISAYRIPEKKAVIPMIIMAPTIINDGRKLFISPHSVSYMNIQNKDVRSEDQVSGVDLIRYFKDYNGENLRFTSALRMNATFPYITPNISLPTSPKVQIMDAGITDNFGITNAIQFLYVFRDWISEHTSGVIILSIRDTERNNPITGRDRQTLFEKFFTPITSIYNSWWDIQDISNDNRIEMAESWFGGNIIRVNLEYNSQTPLNALLNQEPNHQRATLNWRLTTREKKNIKNNIFTPRNKEALQQLIDLLK